MSTKQRLSASVDSDLLEAANAAVKQGRSDSVSAWVNDALRRHVAHEDRLQALDEFLHWYEDEHGEITAEEMATAEQWAAQRTIEVGGSRRSGAPSASS